MSASKAAHTRAGKKSAKPMEPVADKHSSTGINARPYFAEPALSSDGSQLTFVYGGDIWLVPSQGGMARQITSNVSADSAPVFSPDNREIAFLSQRNGSSNLYITSLGSSSPPRRLSFHANILGRPNWSRSGKWIYFTSSLERLAAGLYKIPANGATPIPLLSDPFETYFGAAISPNGKQLAFNVNGDAWWRKGPNPAQASHIWLLDEASGEVQQCLTSHQGRNRDAMWAGNGRGIFYLSDREGVENIWYMTLKGDSTARRITNFSDDRILRPSISADGRWITFMRDFSIWILETASGDLRRVEVQIQADDRLRSVKYADISSAIDEFKLAKDGKKLAFSSYGQIFADLPDKGEHGIRGGNAFVVTHFQAHQKQISWHPESRKIVYVSDRSGTDQVYSYDFVSNTDTCLTDSPANKFCPVYSPDGKWLAYGSDRSEIWLMNCSTGKHRKFIKGQRFLRVLAPTEFCWSPDSQWIAFVSANAEAFENISVQKLRTRKSQQLTFLNNLQTGEIIWSANGKFLVFFTGHYRSEGQIARLDLKPLEPMFPEEDFEKLFTEPDEGKKSDSGSEGKKGKGDSEKEKGKDKGNGKDESKKDEPVVIQFEGIKRRMRFLTEGSPFAIPLAVRPDSKLLVFYSNMSLEPHIWSLSLDDDRPREAPKALLNARGLWGSVEFTPDGKKLYMGRNGGISWTGVNEDGSRKGSTTALPVKGEVEVDRRDLQRRAFRQGWNMLREHFYDPDFHGCDWQAVYHRYLPVALGALTRHDFTEILNLMVGELNASHLGAMSGNWQSVADSFVGLEFERDLLESRGQFRIRHVLNDSPAALAKNPPVAGDYLLAINGEELDGRRDNLPEKMQRQSGRRLKLLINSKPRKKGAREIQVLPVHGGKIFSLKYREWVEKNGEYVLQKSDNRLGYVHIPQMSYRAYMNFIADLDAEAYERDGVIIDVRFNGGGHIATFILDLLSRRTYAWSGYRGMVRTNDSNFAGNRVLAKPLILITNEHSYSNAEMFSEGFRRLGLGKIVGHPTGGAVIWTTAIRLVDGTVLRLPRGYVQTLDGENIELRGRPVDFFADRPPGESARGQDSQLDVAVRELLRQIDEDTSGGKQG